MNSSKNNTCLIRISNALDGMEEHEKYSVLNILQDCIIDGFAYEEWAYLRPKVIELGFTLKHAENGVYYYEIK